MSQARKTAKLVFPGDTVKLHQEFQIGIHESHELGAVLSRADIILAAVQLTANLPALKFRGWTDAETQTTVRGTFPSINPANAPKRAEFRLGIFPPDHHVAPATPTPQATQAPQP
jgi:hypothetical protein